MRGVSEDVLHDTDNLARAMISADDRTPFSEWRSAYFRNYLALHPEEATTLGVAHHASRLSDLSKDGIALNVAFFERTLRDVASFDTSALDDDARLDLRAIRSLAEFSLRELRDRTSYRTNLELSSFPHTMLAHQSAHAKGDFAWSVLAERARRVPLYLAQQEANLREGLDLGETVDTEIARCFIDHVLPGSIQFLRELAERQPAHAASFEAAAEAYAAHLAFVKDKLFPRSRECFAIGRAEVEFRLERFLGRQISLDDLLDDAKVCLTKAQAELVTLADRVARTKGATVATHKEAAEFFRKLWADHPATLGDALATYRDVQERALAFIRSTNLFSLPEPFRLELRTLPPGVAVGTPATNWPAPLLDRKQTGAFLISPDVNAHSISGAANLAVHEGIPGHYLQSAAWQAQFSDDPSPVRFVCVADDVAMASQYYGSMVNIEGFAAYAEELMLAEGFYTDEEALLSVVSKAIRAARVIADLSLHAGTMSREEAACMLSESAAMPLAWARGQVLRYSRTPLQAMTYHVGCRQIWALKEKAKAQPHFTQAIFHQRLFDVGPIPPSVAESRIVI